MPTLVSAPSLDFQILFPEPPADVVPVLQTVIRQRESIVLAIQDGAKAHIVNLAMLPVLTVVNFPEDQIESLNTDDVPDTIQVSIATIEYR
ncbi:hypothetical protein [Gordonia sp. CPCC 205333]|uniref:hypothetical protein n=1 Tax=Gordonia sp. CPCC 205333 TaxID=3140790 RepID=UPI003AF37136